MVEAHSAVAIQSVSVGVILRDSCGLASLVRCHVGEDMRRISIREVICKCKKQKADYKAVNEFMMMIIEFEFLSFLQITLMWWSSNLSSISTSAPCFTSSMRRSSPLRATSNRKVRLATHHGGRHNCSFLYSLTLT